MESGDRGQTGDWVHYCGHMPPLSIVSTLSSLSIVSTQSILATSYQAELHGDTETTSTRPPWPAPCNARRRVAETPRKLQQNNQQIEMDIVSLSFTHRHASCLSAISLCILRKICSLKAMSQRHLYIVCLNRECYCIITLHSIFCVLSVVRQCINAS